MAEIQLYTSDGLLIDLKRILTASNKGATIWIENLPLSEDFKLSQICPDREKINYALSGGEDYELLFTVPQVNIEKLLHAEQETGLSVTRIGEINTSGSLVVLDKNHKPYTTDNLGYDHFINSKGNLNKTPPP